MSIFSDEEIQAIQGQANREQTSRDKQIGDRNAKKRQFDAAIVRAIKLYREVVSEYPKIANAFGIPPTTIDVPDFRKWGKDKKKKSQPLWHLDLFFQRAVMVDMQGNTFAPKSIYLNDDKKCKVYELNPFDDEAIDYIVEETTRIFDWSYWDLGGKIYLDDIWHNHSIIVTLAYWAFAENTLTDDVSERAYLKQENVPSSSHSHPITEFVPRDKDELLELIKEHLINKARNTKNVLDMNKSK